MPLHQNQTWARTTILNWHFCEQAVLGRSVVWDLGRGSPGHNSQHEGGPAILMRLVWNLTRIPSFKTTSMVVPDPSTFLLRLFLGMMLLVEADSTSNKYRAARATNFVTSIGIVRSFPSRPWVSPQARGSRFGEASASFQLLPLGMFGQSPSKEERSLVQPLLGWKLFPAFSKPNPI